MKITHNNVFLFGFVYYLIAPMLIISSSYLDGYPAVDNWKSNFNESFVIRYYTIIFFIFISFYLGSWLGKIIQINNSNHINKKEKHYSFSILFYLLFFGSLYIIGANSGNFFTGYKNYNTALLGQLGTINTLLVMIFVYRKILFYNYGTHKNNKLLIYLIIVISILLLGNGSRMATLFAILSIIIFNINYNLLPVKKAFFILAVTLISFLGIANIRIGGSFNPDLFAYFFFAEPMFTSFSTMSYLNLNSNLEAFNVPLNYLSSFLNFIPSAIMPDKNSYIINMRTLAEYTAPMGADSIFVSLVVNFGYIGGFFFIFCFGFMMSIIRKQTTVFSKTYYILLLAIIPFQFFRDNFAILNKVILYNILFLPMLYFMLINLLKKNGNANYIR